MNTLAALIAVLLPVFAKVESNNNPNAVGDKGNAVGIYQIWPSYVEDVNRISKRSYTLEDRKDAKKSKEMVEIYLTHYGRRVERLTGRKATLEDLARIHNGGPNGFKKDCTKKYWSRCKKHLKGETK